MAGRKPEESIAPLGDKGEVLSEKGREGGRSIPTNIEWEGKIAGGSSLISRLQGKGTAPFNPGLRRCRKKSAPIEEEGGCRRSKYPHKKKGKGDTLFQREVIGSNLKERQR